MSAALIDSLNQVEIQSGQSNVGTLDRVIGIGQSVYSDILTIAEGVSSGLGSLGSLQDARDSHLALTDQALGVISKYGNDEQKAEARAIDSSGTTNKIRADKLAKLANEATRNVDPVSSDPATSKPASSAIEKLNRPAGAGRKYNYDGPCPTMTSGGVFVLARDGSKCGRRAASIRPGGWWV